MAESTWHAYNSSPIFLLPKNPRPTADITKSGPELLVNVIRRSASVFVSKPCSYSFSVEVAPIGYPLRVPRKNAGAEAPGTLNRGRIIPSKNFPMITDIFVWLRHSHITKKGNTAGNTTLNHKLIPSLQDDMASLEYMIRRIIKVAHNKLLKSKESSFTSLKRYSKKNVVSAKITYINVSVLLLLVWYTTIFYCCLRRLMRNVICAKIRYYILFAICDIIMLIDRMRGDGVCCLKERKFL